MTSMWVGSGIRLWWMRRKIEDGAQYTGWDVLSILWDLPRYNGTQHERGNDEGCGCKKVSAVKRLWLQKCRWATFLIDFSIFINFEVVSCFLQCVLARSEQCFVLFLNKTDLLLRETCCNALDQLKTSMHEVFAASLKAELDPASFTIWLCYAEFLVANNSMFRERRKPISILR